MITFADALRNAENVQKPDPRNEVESKFDIPPNESVKFKTHHASVAALGLHENVPAEVAIQFETTKNINLYAWFVYRFYPIATQHAYACLELALRIRFEQAMLNEGERKREFGPGLRRLLDYAIKNGHLKNEGFHAWRKNTEMRARNRYQYEKMMEMEQLGVEEIELHESEVEITKQDRDHNYLQVISETVPWLRNHSAHGSTSLTNQVMGTLQMVSEIINQIFSLPELTE